VPRNRSIRLSSGEARLKNEKCSCAARVSMGREKETQPFSGKGLKRPISAPWQVPETPIRFSAHAPRAENPYVIAESRPARRPSEISLLGVPRKTNVFGVVASRARRIRRGDKAPITPRPRYSSVGRLSGIRSLSQRLGFGRRAEANCLKRNRQAIATMRVGAAAGWERGLVPDRGAGSRTMCHRATRLP